MTQPSRVEKSAEVGAYIREYRARHELRLADVSERCGISVPQLALLETGRRRITVDDLHVLGDALGVAPSSLLMRASLWA